MSCDFDSQALPLFSMQHWKAGMGLGTKLRVNRWKTGFEGQRNFQESLRDLQESFRWLSSLIWTKNSSRDIVCIVLYYIHALKWKAYTNLIAHNSRTAPWEKYFIPVSYCRATQKLQNGGLIIGIDPNKPKHTTFMPGTFCECLWIACTKYKSIHSRAHECLWVMELDWEEGKKVALPLVSAWSRRSER